MASLTKLARSATRRCKPSSTKGRTLDATIRVRRSTNGSFYWTYRASNGNIVASGKGYNRRADAWRGFDKFRLGLTLGNFKTVDRVRRTPWWSTDADA